MNKVNFQMKSQNSTYLHSITKKYYIKQCQVKVTSLNPMDSLNFEIPYTQIKKENNDINKVNFQVKNQKGTPR